MSEFLSKAEIEQNKENKVDLTNLSISFDSDKNIRNLFSEKKVIENYEEWFKENKKELEKKQDEIIKAVEMSILTDSDSRTIYNFVVERSTKDADNIIKIKNNLEENLEDILQKVIKNLEEFIPNWKIPFSKLKFSVYERADFRIDRNFIYADLRRLVYAKKPIEKVIKGITHEVFHIWMGELNNWLDSKQEQATNQELKNQIIYKVIDEGLAVLISEQSLKDYHEKQGRKYSDYKKESFKKFKEFLKENNRKYLKKTKEDEFKNMGNFYVVGYEIVNSILKKEGLEEFKKIIIEARAKPEIFLEKYGLI